MVTLHRREIPDDCSQRRQFNHGSTPINTDRNGNLRRFPFTRSVRQRKRVSIRVYRWISVASQFQPHFPGSWYRCESKVRGEITAEARRRLGLTDGNLREAIGTTKDTESTKEAARRPSGVVSGRGRRPDISPELFGPFFTSLSCLSWVVSTTVSKVNGVAGLSGWNGETTD